MFERAAFKLFVNPEHNKAITKLSAEDLSALEDNPTEPGLQGTINAKASYPFCLLLTARVFYDSATLSVDSVGGPGTWSCFNKSTPTSNGTSTNKALANSTSSTSSPVIKDSTFGFSDMLHLLQLQ